MKLIIPEIIKSLTCKEVMDNYYSSLDLESRLALRCNSSRPVKDVWSEFSAAVRCELNCRCL